MKRLGELPWMDRVLGVVFGAAIAALAWITGNNAEIPPELWNDFSVAAGLRPPSSLFPSCWRQLAAFDIARAGLEVAAEHCRLLGPVALGVVSTLVYRIFTGMLPLSLRTMAERTRRGRWMARLLVFTGAVLFVGSEPVWRVGRVFSPEMLLLLLTFFVFRLALWAVESSRPCAVLHFGFFSGVLAAESAFGFIPPVVLALFFNFRVWPAAYELPPLANPVVRTVVLRRMVAVFCAAWLLFSFMNIAFAAEHGVVGADADRLILFFRYLLHYAGSISSALSPVGWIFLLMIALAPLIYAAARIRAATDLDSFLPVRHGVFHLIAGVACALQSTAFSSCRFWRWIPGSDPIPSAYLLALCLFCTSITAFFALSILTAEVMFRNNRRIAAEMMEKGDFADEEMLSFMRSLRTLGRLMRPALFLVPTALVLCVLPNFFDGTVRTMSRLVNEAARMTAEECADAPLIFSDGALDAAVECAAARSGRTLKALSFMSGSSPYEVALRTHGVTNEQDRTLFSVGTASALRSLVRNGSPVISNIALQVGFELWRHDRLPMPDVGGFVARTAGFGSGGALLRVDAARDLAARIIGLCRSGDPFEKGYPKLNTLFSFVEWRLSRMCRMRANAADTRSDSAVSSAEHELADNLDAVNPQWRRVQERMDWIGLQGATRLTPQEGLRLGLDRADFSLARSYARQVLEVSPDDPVANFAMGMSCFTEHQYGRAEHFLKRAREKSPDEPAILNNLAVVLLRLDRFAEAETNAIRALKLFPSSSEIKETLRRIRQASGKK